MLGKNQSEYSANEQELLLQFVGQEVLENVNPIHAYDMCAREAFTRNMSGPHVEALRRALNNLDNGIWRGTAAFEASLIYEY